jgi:hypothetical protein
VWNETPNPKHQAPEKSWNRNTKNQVPNTKEIPSSKLQTAARALRLELGVLELELLWSLVFGVWSFHWVLADLGADVVKR